MPERLQRVQVEESKEISRLAVEHWSLATSQLPTDIERRGVDTSVLPRYAYRDDGQLVWAAIHDYVTNYLQAVLCRRGAHQSAPPCSASSFADLYALVAQAHC